MRKLIKYILAGVITLAMTVPAFAGDVASEHLTNLIFKERVTGNDAQVEFGVDDDGLDVEFFGATASSVMLWDESNDALIFTGADIQLKDGDLLVFGTGAGVAGDVQIDFTDGTGLLIVGYAAVESLLLGSDTYALNTTLKGTLTVGKNNTGHDVKFFGVTDGSYILWDESDDQLELVASGILLDEDEKITFKDSAIHIQAADDGHLDLEADISIDLNGDIVVSGHSDGQEFLVNAFQFPNPGTDWTPGASGAELGASLSSKVCYLPLNFLKIGDEIISYKLVGDIVEANTVTLDCKLVSVNLADPLTTTDITDGGIAQQDADGNFDVEADCDDTTVATDKQYYLEITGTTGTSDAIYVIGAEITINRKV